MLANMFGFQPEQFFEAEEEAREDVRVSFGTGDAWCDGRCCPSRSARGAACRPRSAAG